MGDVISASLVLLSKEKKVSDIDISVIKTAELYLTIFLYNKLNRGGDHTIISCSIPPQYFAYNNSSFTSQTITQYMTLYCKTAVKHIYHNIFVTKIVVVFFK